MPQSNTKISNRSLGYTILEFILKKNWETTKILYSIF